MRDILLGQQYPIQKHRSHLLISISSTSKSSALSMLALVFESSSTAFVGGWMCGGFMSFFLAGRIPDLMVRGLFVNILVAIKGLSYTGE